MLQQEALAIIKNESLDATNFFNIDRLHFESTVIAKDTDVWEVYIYGERGQKEGLKLYDNESEALDDYVERLRTWKRILAYRERKKVK